MMNQKSEEPHLLLYEPAFLLLLINELGATTFHYWYNAMLSDFVIYNTTKTELVSNTKVTLH